MRRPCRQRHLRNNPPPLYLATNTERWGAREHSYPTHLTSGFADLPLSLKKNGGVGAWCRCSPQSLGMANT